MAYHTLSEMMNITYIHLITLSKEWKHMKKTELVGGKKKLAECQSTQLKQQSFWQFQT